MNVRTVRELAAVIRQARQRQGLSQTALAASAGVGREWIIELEKGKASVELGLVLRTLKSLGLSIQLGPPSPAATGSVDLGQLIHDIRKEGGE